MSEPVVRISAAQNGYAVEIYDPPKSDMKDGECCAPFGGRWRVYVADDLTDVTELIQKELPLAAKRANPKSDFDYAYREIKESESE